MRQAKCAKCGTYNKIEKLHERMKFHCKSCGVKNTIIFTTVIMGD